LGATFVDKKRDMAVALKHWRLAVKDRYSDFNDMLEKSNKLSPIAAYENAKEVRTFQELADLITGPDAMRMQGLLIRECILGPAHPNKSYYQYIRYRSAVYAYISNFEIGLYLYKSKYEITRTTSVTVMKLIFYLPPTDLNFSINDCS
jgi:hypothetical protein